MNFFSMLSQTKMKRGQPSQTPALHGTAIAKKLMEKHASSAASASYTVTQTADTPDTAEIKQGKMQLISGEPHVLKYLSNPLAKGASPGWEESVWAEYAREDEKKQM